MRTAGGIVDTGTLWSISFSGIPDGRGPHLTVMALGECYIKCCCAPQSPQILPGTHSALHATSIIQLLTTLVHMRVERRAHPAGARGPTTTRPVACTAVVTKKRDLSTCVASSVKQMKDAPWPGMTQSDQGYSKSSFAHSTHKVAIVLKFVF